MEVSLRRLAAWCSLIYLLILLLLLVRIRSVGRLTHRNTLHGLLHLLHLHLILWLVWIVIVMRLGHGSSLQKLLLLILVDVLLLPLIVFLCCEPFFFLKDIIILQVADAGVLHVLPFDEEDVNDAKNDKDGTQDGQANGVLYIVTMAP